MKLLVVPFCPTELNIEADSKLGDASKRIPSGVKLIVSWLLPDGTERGIKYFISENDLTGYANPSK